MRFVLEIGCHHPEVRVMRCHPTVVRPEMEGKLLYVDKYGVHCFVQCVKCKAFLRGKQREPLFDTIKEVLV